VAFAGKYVCQRTPKFSKSMIPHCHHWGKETDKRLPLAQSRHWADRDERPLLTQSGHSSGFGQSSKVQIKNGGTLAAVFAPD